MSVPFAAASNAYASAAQLGNAGQQGSQLAQKPTDGPNFGEMLTNSLTEVVESGRVADQKAMDLVNGDANVVDVVTAISETEIAMETVVTIRDRVITAYESIMQMPI